MTKSLKDFSSRISKRKTFESEVNEIEMRLPVKEKKQNLYHWFIASQFSSEQKARAVDLMRLEAGSYDDVDFDHRMEEESQRYTLVNRNFIKVGRDISPRQNNNQQKLHDMCGALLAPGCPREGKTLILLHKKKDVDICLTRRRIELSMRWRRTCIVRTMCCRRWNTKF